MKRTTPAAALWFCSSFLLALGSPAANGQPLLPPRWAPLEAGEIAAPQGFPQWSGVGSWVDDNTLVSLSPFSGQVIFHRADGTILQVVDNPDNPSWGIVTIGDSLAVLDGHVFVLSYGDGRTIEPAVHVYKRKSANGEFVRIARVSVAFSGPEFGAVARFNVEDGPGGISTRCVTLTRNVGLDHIATVLRPSGRPVAWSVEQFVYPPTNTANAGAFIRGNLMAMSFGGGFHSCTMKFWTRNAQGQWDAAGELTVAGTTGENFLSEPVIVDEMTVFVGNAAYQQKGRVLRLQRNGATNWYIAEQIMSPTSLIGSKWGSAIGGWGDWLFVARAKGTPGVPMLETRRRNADLSWTLGPSFQDVDGVTASWNGAFKGIEMRGDTPMLRWQRANETPVQWLYARAPFALDLDRDGVIDLDAIASGHVTDCNRDAIPDEADIALGLEDDLDRDGIPDACQTDCDSNGVSNYEELIAGAPDCNGNLVPDGCDLLAPNADLNSNGLLDACEPDCNRNGIADSVELMLGALEDCDGNGVPDTCDRYQPAVYSGASTSTNYGTFVWFPVQPEAPVICGVDVECLPGAASVPIVVAVVRGWSSVGGTGAISSQDVVLVESCSPVSAGWPEEQGGAHFQRFTFRPVDLTGVPAYWIFVKSGRQHPSASVDTPDAPGRTYLPTSAVGVTASSVAGRLGSLAPQPTSAAAVWVLTPSCAGIADITHDGVVDGQDLGRLLGAWNTTSSAADLDGNGIVAGGDLGMLLAAWSTSSP